MAHSEPDPRGATATAILLAAGRSERMRAQASGAGGTLHKPFLPLAGRTVLEHTCAAFERATRVDAIVIVAHADDIGRVRQLAAECPDLAKVRAIVEGGRERADSVHQGVLACADGTELIAIHDVARPLIAPEAIDTAVGIAAIRGACLVAVPMTDTVKTSVDGRCAERTLDRSVLWRAQTPQVFAFEQMRKLIEVAREDGFRPTDDAALYERYVGAVPILEGDPHNIKLTTPDDFVVAESLLRARRSDGPSHIGERPA